MPERNVAKLRKHWRGQCESFLTNNIWLLKRPPYLQAGGKTNTHLLKECNGSFYFHSNSVFDQAMKRCWQETTFPPFFTFFFFFLEGPMHSWGISSVGAELTRERRALGEPGLPHRSRETGTWTVVACSPLSSESAGEKEVGGFHLPDKQLSRSLLERGRGNVSICDFVFLPVWGRERPAAQV